MSSFLATTSVNKTALYKCIHTHKYIYPPSPICQNLLQRNFPKHFNDRQQDIGRHVACLVFTPAWDYDFAVSSSAAVLCCVCSLPLNKPTKKHAGDTGGKTPYDGNQFCLLTCHCGENLTLSTFLLNFFPSKAYPDSTTAVKTVKWVFWMTSFPEKF